ncbi:dipeptide ABC transporter ATP-binding protein [Parageobacillus thermoglucosidasius]|uniref:ABC transporter ATP-binding protein n=1 Tax=Parageobacillus thermoglucosidasius TaxID=1426 RepID=UPI003B683925
MGATLLDVNDLTVGFKTKNGLLTAISNIFLTIKPSETICLVGESGSGKSVMAKTIMRLIDYDNGIISKGRIQLEDQDLTALSNKELNRIRGKKIAMISQEPLSAFDPVFTIGDQLVETMVKHLKLSKKEAWQRGTELLAKVGLSDPAIRMKQYPNELSGGMLQRAMIAMALSCHPDLLIADEPTTALDVTIQSQIIHLLNSLKKEFNMAVLLITHDLGVAAQLADRIVVMYAGTIVEEGTVEQIFSQPHHPYTSGLLQSIPSINSKKEEKLFSIEGSIPNLSDMPEGCRFHPRCPFATEKCRLESPPLNIIEGQKSACWHTSDLIAKKSFSVAEKQGKSLQYRVSIKPANIAKEPLLEVRGLSKYYPIKYSRKKIKAVDHVSLKIYKGETFGLVGESGSGKSTFGRLLLHLEKPTHGEVLFNGRSLSALSKKELRKQRREMQMIFQDPYGSIDPKWRIKDIIAEPLQTHFKDKTKKELLAMVEELLEKVGLNPEWMYRYPHEFSGGQRQRIGIARAIAVHPSFILADEAVSALDVSVQAQIINLLKELQQTLGLTYLFIGHDLNVVRYISDRIGVMYLGRIVEIAPSDELFENPLHPYTSGLIQSIPSIDKVGARQVNVLKGEIPSPANPPSGCAFRTRCPFATELCSKETPDLVEMDKEHFVACHYAVSWNMNEINI